MRIIDIKGDMLWLVICDFDLRLMNLKAQAEGCTFDPFEVCKPKDEDLFKLKARLSAVRCELRLVSYSPHR